MFPLYGLRLGLTIHQGGVGGGGGMLGEGGGEGRGEGGEEPQPALLKKDKKA